jgi:hypothetical protein
MENEAIEWFGRLDGPLNLRLLLQPTIAAIFGYRDGVRDAVNNAPPYFWNVTHVLPEERQQLIRHGWASIGKVFVIAVVLDCLFQFIATGYVAVVGAIVAASILAVLPYLFFRGAVNRWKRARSQS